MKNKFQPMPDYEEKYYYLNDYNEIKKATWFSDKKDRVRYYNHNVFIDKKNAKIKQAKNESWIKIKEFIKENGLEFEPDWNNYDEAKYYIVYDYTQKMFNFNYEIKAEKIENENKIPYLKGIDDCVKLIDKMQDDLKIIYNLTREDIGIKNQNN